MFASEVKVKVWLGWAGLDNSRNRSEETMSNIPYNLNNSTLKSLFVSILSQFYADLLSMFVKMPLQNLYFLTWV